MYRALGRWGNSRRCDSPPHPMARYIGPLRIRLRSAVIPYLTMMVRFIPA